MHIRINQHEVLEVREKFFKWIQEEWERAPERIDNIMGQQSYYIPPEEIIETPSGLGSTAGESIMDTRRGLLLRSFLAESRQMFNGKPKKTMRFFYSIFQAGDWIRFGILIRGEHQYHERLFQEIKELEKVWDRPADVVRRGSDGMLIEWRFIEPDFYENYAIQERFIHLARHLHFRLGWIISKNLNESDLDPNELNDVYADFEGLDGLDGLDEDGFEVNSLTIDQQGHAVFRKGQA